MGIGARSVCVCGNGRAGRQEGKEGFWTTYVNLSDCYVNNATHNYQGIKCVPCINKIMLRRVEVARDRTEKRRKRKEKQQKHNIRHLKNDEKDNRSQRERRKKKIKTLYS